MWYEIPTDVIMKRYRSFHALYEQSNRDLMGTLIHLAESYEVMKKNRDFWQEDAMEYMKEKRQLNRGKKQEIYYAPI